MTINGEAQYCYLTTTGRKSGQPREIEIWFGLIGSTVYMLSGSGEDERGPKAHWLRNILADPHVTVRIDDVTYPGVGRVVERGTAEDAAARALVVPKYQPGYGNDLTNWGRTSVVVAVDVALPPGS
jgi:deazaflavin-dependent oxidoreductase (nitroreductase family)